MVRWVCFYFNFMSKSSFGDSLLVGLLDTRVMYFIRKSPFSLPNQSKKSIWIVLWPKKKPLTKMKKKCRNSSKKKLLPNWVKKTPIRRTLIKAGHGHIRFAATFIKINSVHQLLSLYKRVGNQRKITIKLHHTHTLTNECMRTWVRNGKAVVCWKWSVSLFSPQLCSSFVKYNAIYNGIECPFFFSLFVSLQSCSNFHN